MGQPIGNTVVTPCSEHLLWTCVPIVGHPPRRRRFTATTDSDHDEPVFPDRSREREADGPNQLWVADLTLLVAESVPAGKDLIIRLIVNLLVETTD